VHILPSQGGDADKMVKFIVPHGKWVLALEIVITLARELRDYLREKSSKPQ
jgi:hypothetical protein